MFQAVRSNSKLDIRTCDNTFACEVVGVDVKTLNDDQFAALENAFDEHGVLYIRGQAFEPCDLVDFSKRFGDVEAHVRQEYSLPGCPEIHVLSNIKDGERTIGSAYAGDSWHLDLSFLKIIV